MRFARGDMRDHIVSHKNDRGASYRRYRVLQRRSRLKINFCEIFGVVQFSTFATKSAIIGLMHRNNRRLYSITSSASASKFGGTTMPSALAVLRLITKVNLLACSTGSSPGLAPFKIFAA
jgi:hypothetical protein